MKQFVTKFKCAKEIHSYWFFTSTLWDGSKEVAYENSAEKTTFLQWIGLGCPWRSLRIDIVYERSWVNLFFKSDFVFNFWRTRVLLCGPLIPLFWTYGDVSSGFRSQSWQPYWLYLFHIPATWHWWDSNGRHTSSHTNALPTECIYVFDDR